MKGTLTKTEMKIDKRINYRIVIDTETCPLDNTVNDVNPYNMFTYDIAWAICDKHGNIYRTRSFLVEEIFFNEPDLMQNAYYADKRETYLKKLDDGEIVKAKWYDILMTFKADCKEFEVTEVYAHNMRFDYGTLATTERWLTKSKYRYFFPYGLTICDTLKMSRQVISKMPTYKKFCVDNGFMTKNNQVRINAESLARFLKKDTSYEEKHMALDDVLDEVQIMAYCFRQHKKMQRKLWAD